MIYTSEVAEAGRQISKPDATTKETGNHRAEKKETREGEDRDSELLGRRCLGGFGGEQRMANGACVGHVPGRRDVQWQSALS